MSDQWSGEPGDEAGDDVDLERAVSEVERKEARRRRWSLVFGVFGFAVLIGGMFGIFYCQEHYFPPRVGIDASGRSALEKTDDPECRRMIADVEQIRRDFFAYEAELERTVPGGGRGARRVGRAAIRPVEEGAGPLVRVHGSAHQRSRGDRPEGTPPGEGRRRSDGVARARRCGASYRRGE
ncbi:MAG: hypothetical protein ABEL76_16430, partial [Bradymonadaceae bacterium]